MYDICYPPTLFYRPFHPRTGLTIKQNKHVLRASREGGSLCYGLLLFIFCITRTHTHTHTHIYMGHQNRPLWVLIRPCSIHTPIIHLSSIIHTSSIKPLSSSIIPSFIHPAMYFYNVFQFEGLWRGVFVGVAGVRGIWHGYRSARSHFRPQRLQSQH